MRELVIGCVVGERIELERTPLRCPRPLTVELALVDGAERR